jgi:hypothetical protein
MSRLLGVVAACLAGCASGSTTQTDAAPDSRRIDAAVDANLCSQDPCSILPQCGCIGNQACDVDTSDNNGTKCRAINMPGTETTACSTAVECDRGYVCLGGSAYASCKKYCSGDADCGAPRGRCVYDISAGGSPIVGVPPACSSNCDPTDTTAALCPAADKCTLFTQTHNGSPVKIVDCSPAGTGTQGADCTTTSGGGFESKCAKGYQCVKFSTESTYKCRRICSAVGTTTGCGANNCIGFADPHTIGSTTYGICGP